MFKKQFFISASTYEKCFVSSGTCIAHHADQCRYHLIQIGDNDELLLKNQRILLLLPTCGLSLQAFQVSIQWQTCHILNEKLHKVSDFDRNIAFKKQFFDPFYHEEATYSAFFVQ